MGREPKGSQGAAGSRSDGSSGGDTRIFPGHVQCSTHGRVGHTLL